jgi:hypothetical protein
MKAGEILELILRFRGMPDESGNSTATCSMKPRCFLMEHGTLTDDMVPQLKQSRAGSLAAA